MEGYIGEIRMFAGNFAPRDWAYCEGQLLPISQYNALFSILGTTYGGDGRSTFALPDLRRRVPIGPGNGPGLSNRNRGEKGGTEENLLQMENLPTHDEEEETKTAMPGNRNLRFAAKARFLQPHATGSIPADMDAVNTKVEKPVENMQPWLGINFIICLNGLYPSRS